MKNYYGQNTDNFYNLALQVCTCEAYEFIHLLLNDNILSSKDLTNQFMFARDFIETALLSNAAIVTPTISKHIRKRIREVCDEVIKLDQKHPGQVFEFPYPAPAGLNMGFNHDKLCLSADQVQILKELLVSKVFIFQSSFIRLIREHFHLFIDGNQVTIDDDRCIMILSSQWTSRKKIKEDQGFVYDNYVDRYLDKITRSPDVTCYKLKYVPFNEKGKRNPPTRYLII